MERYLKAVARQSPHLSPEQTQAVIDRLNGGIQNCCDPASVMLDWEVLATSLDDANGEAGDALKSLLWDGKFGDLVRRASLQEQQAQAPESVSPAQQSPDGETLAATRTFVGGWLLDMNPHVCEVRVAGQQWRQLSPAAFGLLDRLAAKPGDILVLDLPAQMSAVLELGVVLPPLTVTVAGPQLQDAMPFATARLVALFPPPVANFA